MFSREWDILSPADTQLAGEGAEEIRKLKIDIKERLELDHCMEGESDPNKSNADGRHKKLTMMIFSNDPGEVEGAVVLYMKDDGLYYRTTDGIYKI